MCIVVLRLGHRPERDKRITTHVGLVARAFGATEMIMNTRDGSVEESIVDVVERWGGDFKLKIEPSWRASAQRWKDAGGKVVHLTMYGSRLQDVIEDIKKCDQIMVAVGAEKVPAEMYDLADWNVAVGNQPHSEVAALAIFLDKLMDGKELSQEFEGDIKIIPTFRGKMVVERE